MCTEDNTCYPGIIVPARHPTSGHCVWSVGLLLIGFLGSLGCKEDQRSQKPKVEAAAVKELLAIASPTAPKATTPQPVAPANVGKANRVEHRSATKCADICAIAVPLRCRNARECMPRCESMASAPVCAVEVNSLFDCLVRQPIQNWECDEDGIGAIRDTFCGKDQGRLAGCIESNLAR